MPEFQSCSFCGRQKDPMFTSKDSSRFLQKGEVLIFNDDTQKGICSSCVSIAKKQMGTFDNKVMPFVGNPITEHHVPTPPHIA